jgi:hypothetical protein
MRTTILSAVLLSALVAPAQAQVYPVEGKWGQSSGTEQGAIDCADSKRVIEFSGNQRTDSNGGVPAYRNQSVVSEGPSNYRITDEFSTGQISSGRTSYTLRKVDPDHVEMSMQDGGSVKLQRCK